MPFLEKRSLKNRDRRKIYGEIRRVKEKECVFLQEVVCKCG